MIFRININLLDLLKNGMVSYTAQVSAIHKKFNNAMKKAKTKQALNKVYSTHKKDHERLIKKHLAEELRDIKKAKAKLG